MPVELLRAGQFRHASGEVVITRAMLADMARNFAADAYGQMIFVDVAHNTFDGAAGIVRALWVDGDRLLSEVEWTPYGLESIEERGFVYLSAEFHENYRDNEARQFHGATLLGAALTLRPWNKHQQPLKLMALA